MSYQYRVWQEKLVSALKVATTSQDDQYVLLHSATLVGLFTCIFIRQKEKHKVRKLSATEVKTGLGGLHGNKVPLTTLNLELRLIWKLTFPGRPSSPLHTRRLVALLCELPSRSRPIPHNAPQ
jgi:hypothetical protein